MVPILFNRLLFFESALYITPLRQTTRTDKCTHAAPAAPHTTQAIFPFLYFSFDDQENAVGRQYVPHQKIYEFSSVVDIPELIISSTISYQSWTKKATLYSILLRFSWYGFKAVLIKHINKLYYFPK